MTLTLRIDPNLEQQLREEASRRGLEPDSYAVAAIQERLRRDRTGHSHLNATETELLAGINLGFSEAFWDRYDQLIDKRDDEVLSSDEHQELISMGNQVELRNAARIETLAQLARLRNTSLDALMHELGVKPRTSSIATPDFRWGINAGTTRRCPC